MKKDFAHPTPALFFIFIAILLLVFGCGKKFEHMSAKEIYDYGSEKYEKTKYSSAIEAYEALIDLYPFSVYVSKAELGIADSYFHKKHWDEAIPSYEDYINRHPTSEEAPHVIYNLGMCYYKKRIAIDRDQSSTFKAEDSFQRLVTEHPDSTYYEQAKERLFKVRADLAKRERYIARFYFREKEYYASLRRYLRVIQNYPDTKYFEEALYYSAYCYNELGEPKSAKQQIRLLESKFPNGRYSQKAKKLLGKISE